MNFLDLIAKKRDGLTWSYEEVIEIIHCVCDEETPDYQISAMLMAIYLNGLRDYELSVWTQAMAESGDQIDLKNLTRQTIDKHSTGGVGDKTSLVLLPMLAAAGLAIAKLSGKGLGHTGGTIDKLSVFEGFNTNLSRENIREALDAVGLVISGQTENLVPADKRLYALRDLTATVDSIPLIASSIMSKKIATGADILLLDVKFGDGGIFHDFERAKLLAQTMVEIGKSHGINTKAILTDMSSPLGFSIGNANEVQEAIETLSGAGSKELLGFCEDLATVGLIMSGTCKTEEDARHTLSATISSGTALSKFREMVVNQGGDPKFIDHPEKITLAPLKRPILSPGDGYISQLSAHRIGIGSMLLGAGRKTKCDEIDLGAGIILNKKKGSFVSAGEPIMTLYSSKEESLNQAQALLQDVCILQDDEMSVQDLIIAEIS